MLLAKRVHRPVNSFSNIFDSFFNDDILNFPTKVNHWKNTSPSVNIKETEEGFNLELAAPGLVKEDFNLELNDDVLTISSEKKVENEAQKDNYTRREFSYQSFKRSFSLPESVDHANINAKYENGILSITLPKKEEAKPQPKRLIEIG